MRSCFCSLVVSVCESSDAAYLRGTRLYRIIGTLNNAWRRLNQSSTRWGIPPALDEEPKTIRLDQDRRATTPLRVALNNNCLHIIIASRDVLARTNKPSSCFFIAPFIPPLVEFRLLVRNGFAEFIHSLQFGRFLTF